MDQVIVLDALRKQRNLLDYSGDLVPESAVQERVASAKACRSLAKGEQARVDIEPVGHAPAWP